MSIAHITFPQTKNKTQFFSHAYSLTAHAKVSKGNYFLWSPKAKKTKIKTLLFQNLSNSF